jgi:hypothetical protein
MAQTLNAGWRAIGPAVPLTCGAEQTEAENCLSHERLR